MNFVDRSYKIVQYKKKSLIPNIVADKVIDANEKRNTVTDKKSNVVANKAINTNRK